MNKHLEKLYYNLTQPTAYAGAYKIVRAAKKNKNYSKEKVLRWLEAQDAYTLHKPVRKSYPRRMYNVNNKDDVWEGDLADFRNIQGYNNRYKYVLVCIDVLSKYAFAEPLRDKTAVSIANGFNAILQRSKGRVPVCFQSDRGKEFIARHFQEVLRERDIVFRECVNDVKASCIERFIRTLKQLMYRYFTHRGNKRYIDVLQQIIDTYNMTKHSATRLRPCDVDFDNAELARRNILKRYGVPHKLRKYNVDDLVRISKIRSVFSKAYEGGWSQEIFRIAKISESRDPVVYYLEDLEGEPIDTFFYEAELCKVNKNLNTEDFDVEKILKTRGKGRKKQYFVKWKNFSDTFNCWVNAADVKDNGGFLHSFTQ